MFLNLPTFILDLCLPTVSFPGTTDQSYVRRTKRASSVSMYIPDNFDDFYIYSRKYPFFFENLLRQVKRKVKPASKNKTQYNHILQYP